MANKWGLLNWFHVYIPFCSCVVNDYIEAVKGLTCEILELLAEGLRIQDKRILSRLITDSDSDSLLRLNYYPCGSRDLDEDRDMTNQCQIGFGEHSDPQILTVMRSNDVAGLQILLADGVWVPIPPDPCAFFVNVGDILQVSQWKLSHPPLLKWPQCPQESASPCWHWSYFDHFSMVLPRDSLLC